MATELSTIRGRVLGLLAVLMFLAGSFTAMDAVRAWMAVVGAVPFDDWPGPLVQASAVLRMVRSVLCLVLVLQVVPAVRLRPRDDHLLTAAMVLAVVGDAFLIFREGHPRWVFLLGVGAFLLCHGVLVVRHLAGLPDDLERPGVVGRLALVGVGVTALSTAVVAGSWSVLVPEVDLPYMAILSVSLWAALGVAVRADDRDFPRVNRGLIAGGLALFYLCDVALGVHARWSAAVGPIPAVVGLGLVPDLTYSWALGALALSGLRWDRWMGEAVAPSGSGERSQP